MRQRAYEHLQRKILAGELRGGQVVSEQSLATELGISRSPVRDAIRQLETEGALKQVPRFGTVVQTLARRDVVELFELREALEPYAVAQAAGKTSEADLDLLEKLCDEIAEVAAIVRRSPRKTADAALMRRLMAADLGFHMVLLRSSGNRRMAKIISDSRLLSGIFGTPRQEHNLAIIEETLAFHRRILKAVREGDAAKSRRAMAEHISQSMAEAIAHYDQSQASSADLPPTLPEDILRDLKRIENKHEPAET